MIRVLFADECTLIREGFLVAAKLTLDIRLVAEAKTGAQLLRVLEELKGGVIVMATTLPDMDSLEVISYTHSSYPEIPILMLGTESEVNLAIRGLQAGASGFVLKSASSKRLLEAIRRVWTGHKVIDNCIGEKLAFNVGRQSNVELHEVLSNREFQVMRLLAMGLATDEIADRLHVSPTTVRTYKARIFSKMGFDSKAELWRYAAQHNLVQR